MKINSKNKSTIFLAISLLVFFTYKYLPIDVQVFIPLILATGLLFYIFYLIYRKSHLDKIMIVIVSLIATIIAFITLYVTTYKHQNNYSDSIEAIAIVWIFPLIVFVSRIPIKRKGEMNRYKKTFFALLFTIAFAIFWTVVVILKWK